MKEKLNYLFIVVCLSLGIICACDNSDDDVTNARLEKAQYIKNYVAEMSAQYGLNLSVDDKKLMADIDNISKSDVDRVIRMFADIKQDLLKGSMEMVSGTNSDLCKFGVKTRSAMAAEPGNDDTKDEEKEDTKPIDTVVYDKAFTYTLLGTSNTPFKLNISVVWSSDSGGKIRTDKIMTNVTYDQNGTVFRGDPSISIKSSSSTKIEFEGTLVLEAVAFEQTLYFDGHCDNLEKGRVDWRK